MGEADTHTAEARKSEEGGGGGPSGLPVKHDIRAEFAKTGRWGIGVRVGMEAGARAHSKQN